VWAALTSKAFLWPFAAQSLRQPQWQRLEVSLVGSGRAGRSFGRLDLLLALALGVSVSSCTPAKPVAEAEDSAKIVGNWLGTVGNMKESITFSGDGSFPMARPSR
jgi:hypothetical protein